jgi:hypothetical protein
LEAKVASIDGKFVLKILTLLVLTKMNRNVSPVFKPAGVRISAARACCPAAKLQTTATAATSEGRPKPRRGVCDERIMEAFSFMEDVERTLLEPAKRDLRRFLMGALLFSIET